TAARALANERGVAPLELDNLVWEPGKIAVARPVDDAVIDLLDFLVTHDNWVVEGCYGDFAEATLPFCRELVFMNPGQETCIAHARQRPWEPHKFASSAEQDEKLPFLLEWIAGYYTRDDVCSYAYHRKLFD